MSVLERLKVLLFSVNSVGFWLVAVALMLADVAASWTIIHRVPYTEIDWSTYMQQVECYVRKGIYNYSRIEGDTGPVVYPGGHLIFYRALYAVTSKGKDIRTGQYIFMALYLINLALVFRLYHKSRAIVPAVLPLLCVFGYRIHSIFMLRLFNDPVAMLLFYVAVNFFVSQQWLFGCVFYSMAVSIKMNVLLFAPALFFLLLINLGLWRTIANLTVCAIVQIYAGLPFLMHDPVSYVRRSFDLGRVFMFKWTVNWRFLPESVFLDSRLHLALLATHLIVLAVFGWHMWFRSNGGMRSSLVELSHGIRTRIGVSEAMFALFTANLIGITFSRSLHYQFYSWYFHQLPYLLFCVKPVDQCGKEQSVAVPWLGFAWKTCLLLMIEYAWNTYPSTSLSSASLHFAHVVVLVYLCVTRIERPRRKTKLL